MALDKKIDTSALEIGWVSMDGGYEVTRSLNIIRKALTHVKDGHVIINLICKGYQSGGTVLFDFDENVIFIDKPKDWTPDSPKFRVVFRNEAKVWMHFVTKVIKVTDDALHCLLPRELCMLQRRSHYRVLLPGESRVSFVYNDEQCEFDVQDLSVGGLLMYSKFDCGILQNGNRLKDINLSIPCQDKIPGVEEGFFTLGIAEGEVVREFVQEQHPILFCFGVRFYLSETDEEKVLRYVRQRELQVLRKGLSG